MFDDVPDELRESMLEVTPAIEKILPNLPTDRAKSFAVLFSAAVRRCRQILRPHLTTDGNGVLFTLNGVRHCLKNDAPANAIVALECLQAFEETRDIAVRANSESPIDAQELDEWLLALFDAGFLAREAITMSQTGMTSPEVYDHVNSLIAARAKGGKAKRKLDADQKQKVIRELARLQEEENLSATRAAARIAALLKQGSFPGIDKEISISTETLRKLR